MEDLSLHILDIAENSIRAEARRIEISISKDESRDLLRIEIADDGKGMDQATLASIRSPFFTTKGKLTGLGIPFLAQAAEQTGGAVTITSTPGRGTSVTATFSWSHPDRPAVGSVPETLLALIAGHPELDIVYEERDGVREFRLDTAELRGDLDGVPVNAPAVVEALRSLLTGNCRLKT